MVIFASRTFVGAIRLYLQVVFVLVSGLDVCMRVCVCVSARTSRFAGRATDVSCRRNDTTTPRCHCVPRSTPRRHKRKTRLFRPTRPAHSPQATRMSHCRHRRPPPRMFHCRHWRPPPRMPHCRHWRPPAPLSPIEMNSNNTITLTPIPNLHFYSHYIDNIDNISCVCV